MYCTESPCAVCCRLITETSIRSVYYLNLYRINDCLTILKDHNIRVFRMTPSGQIIEHFSGELVT
jgi:deoxycytidylate deaminase